MEPIFDEINQEMKKINDVIAPIQNLTKQGIPVTTADVAGKAGNKTDMGGIIINLVNQLQSNRTLLKKCASNVEILQIKMSAANTKLISANEKLQESMTKQCLTADSLKDMIKTEMDSIIPEIVKQIGAEVLKEGDSSHCSFNTGAMQNEEKHALIIQQKTTEGEAESFSKVQWSDMLQGTVSEKLNEVPVTKSTLTADGKGYVSFPDKQSRDMAAEALKDEFVIEEKNKRSKTLYPKMKICDLEGFKKSDTDRLKSVIPKKNPHIKKLIDEGAELDIIFIHEPPRSQFYGGYAVIRVDPKIREEIIKNKRRIYIDTTSYYMKDQLHVTQCFACQAFGHKKDSPFCPLKNKDRHTCLYCAENHLSRSCQVKYDQSKHKCGNCSKTQKYRNNANHTSTSTECPIHIREVEGIVRRTICDSKNYPMQRVNLPK